MNPIAFAGWIGLFVTSINLIPVGQLDGGHIAFAFLGEKHTRLSFILVVVLSLLGFFFGDLFAILPALTEALRGKLGK